MKINLNKKIGKNEVREIKNEMMKDNIFQNIKKLLPSVRVALGASNKEVHLGNMQVLLQAQILEKLDEISRKLGKDVEDVSELSKEEAEETEDGNSVIEDIDLEVVEEETQAEKIARLKSKK